jgi:hypothetical protein
MIEVREWPPTPEAIAAALDVHRAATHMVVKAEAVCEGSDDLVVSSTRLPLASLTAGEIEATRIRLSATVGDLEPKLSWWLD